MKNKLLLSVFLAVAALGIQGIIRSGRGHQSTEVKVEALKLGTFNEDLIFQGVIFPKENISLYTDTPTVIKSILVKEGYEVQKGDNLLEFSDTVKNDLERELEVIELDLKSRRLQLSDLRSGSIKLELEERELERSSLAEEIKSLNRDIKLLSFEAETSEKRADVMEELLKRKGVSSVEANEARALADRRRNELEDLKTTLNLSKQRYDLSVLSYERLKRELLLNENNIKGEYQKLLLQKNNIEKKLAEIKEPLRAPFAGIITEITAAEGAEVSQGGKLLSISPGNEFIVKLEVPLHQSKWIQVGQKAQITSREGFDNKKYLGEVYNIAKIAKLKEIRGTQERVIEIEVIVENSHGMKPGYVTDVEIKGTYQEGINTVSSFSVVEENGVNYVYTLDGNIVNKTRVDIGAKTTSEYEVLNLPAGTEIVVNPFKVNDGQKVVPIRGGSGD